jgi:hypothetical protein
VERKRGETREGEGGVREKDLVSLTGGILSEDLSAELLNRIGDIETDLRLDILQTTDSHDRGRDRGVR